MGRPRKNQEEWTDEKLVELGKEMIKYFADNEDAYFIQDFAAHKKIPARKLYYLNELVLFSDYYEQAKDICAKRIARGAGKEWGLNAGIAQRFLNAYFYDVRKVELELARAKKLEDRGNTVINYHRDGKLISSTEVQGAADDS